MDTTIMDGGTGDIGSTLKQEERFLRIGELASYGVEWSECTKVTPLGGMVYFGHFLRENGLFDNLVEQCPLDYTSNNAPGKQRVLGTIVAGILNGARRYAHLSYIRGDRLIAEALEIEAGFVSEDSVRRGLKKLIQEHGEDCAEWLRASELATVLPLLREEYILDLDTSVKPVYGHQEGAEISYNPAKPGRPSQTLHVGFIGGLRLMVSVDVERGKAHAACHMMPKIWAWVDDLPPECRPSLIRGDIGFGNDGCLSACEKRGLSGLFKLKISPKLQNVIRKLAALRGAEWKKTREDWEVIESSVKLTGWSHARRIVVLRRPVRAGTSKKRREADWLPQLQLEGAPEWEYAVLACTGALPIESLPKLYAERADCENVLDELKNQWGLRGFTTRDLNRCKVMARLGALVCNWWNVFARIAEPTEHKEAITSRPELLHLMATLVTHGGRKVLRFCTHHENSQGVKRAFTRLHTVFSRIDAIAEQLDRPTVWALQLSVAFYAWLRGKVLKSTTEVEKIIHELVPPAKPCLIR